MGWCQQCCALMRKNRIIKMVGIRAAVTKETEGASLRYGEPIRDAKAIQTARDRNIPVVNGSVFTSDFGPIAWDGDSISTWFYHGDSSTRRGMLDVNTVQFLPGDDADVIAMAAAFQSRYPLLAPNVQTRFKTEKEMEDYVAGKDYATSVYDASIAVAVVLEKSKTTAGDPIWNFVIRGNQTQQARTSTTLATQDSTVNTLQVLYDDQHWPILYAVGHHLMQDFVEEWVMEKEAGITLERSYAFQPFPTPPYVFDDFASVIASVLGLFFTIIYVWPVTRLVKGIVEEKQLRIKEGMRMMGLPDSALYCSWFGTYAIIFVITSILITLVTAGSVYSKSNKVYIFFFFFLFSMSTFSFCWFVSVFFSRSQVATTVSALVFLGFFFPYFAVQSGSTSSGSKGLACLSSPICFGLGAVVIQHLESESGGVNRDTANRMVDNWSYNSTIALFIVDFFIYLILALYFQQVVPSEWGTSQKWYFIFQPSYWCPAKVEARPGGGRANMANSQEMGALPHRELQEKESLAGGQRNADYYFEPVADAIRNELGVSIQNLRRTFDVDGQSEKFVAVKGMNLDLYGSQIVALLGHNGAGKTTTINMLSGMIAPTSGDAFIYGSSIKENMAGVRKILGVCPQHNILYDLLTVKEHLELFAAIKGVPSDQQEATIAEMIAQVGLTEKINDKSAALSGGMQRKLSVGIALLGDSKIVFLDEPTSGMDPYSRRATWDLLKKKKEGRVIILTTHFMDEADQLGDRIAIMAKGDVKCCGSSLFLKGRYGVGYTLTIVKAPNFNEETVTNLIKASIPDTTLLSNIAAEISFRLPFQSSSHFADVFDQFDFKQEELGVVSYGISVTTLEEVFLRVGHEDDATPEGQLARKKTLKEAQKKLSMEESREGPRSPPQDLYDVPATQPELVIDPQTQQPEPAEHNSLAAAAEKPESARAPAAGGMQTISVKGAPDGSASSSDAAAQPMMKRRNSSRFHQLRIPSANTPMFLMHFKALLIKRWLNAKRDRKVWTWTLVYPFLILLIGCGLITLTNVSSYPRLDFNVEGLKQTANHVPYAYRSTSANPIFSGTSYEPDTVFDARTMISTGSNITTMSQRLLDELQDPALQFEFSKYNAFYSDFQSDGSGFGNGYVDNFVVFFNTSCQWSSSFGLTTYNNQVLQSLGSKAKLSISIHPLPQTLNQKTLTNSLTAVIVAIGFAFMPANFIAYAVKEQQDKVKHQQLISGVSALSYWSSNYVWDFCNYMVMGLLCLLIFRIWSIEQLIGENSGATFIAIVLYGLSVIPFNYMMSFLFTEATSAQNSMLLFYIFTGALLLIATIVLSIISTTKSAAYYIKFFCRLIPSYCFGESMANIIVRESATAFGEAKDLWDMQVTGLPMIFMAWESVFYFFVVYMYELVHATPSLMAKIYGNPPVDAQNAVDDDADVINERTRLQSGQGHSDTIKVMGLRKVYKGRLGGGNKIAVQDLWMGIPEGQCFGFLGINGAGKTTTLKMLTGDIIPGKGTATLNGLDILTHQNEVRRLLGYCPQFDALIDTLTGREHLALFARIKGVPEEIIPDYCEHLILKLGLQEGIADKPSKGYSGGNKRKLCVGIALIGNPPIVFLDEPSTGMDPGSRRFMWDLIASTMKNRSVILTTHSMEECEALCHRVGIMVGGRLRCLGSTTHLKNVYGSGYQLDVNVSVQAQPAFKQRLSETWDEVKIIEEHGNSFKFRIPRESRGQKTTIGTVFRFVESVKKEFDIKDYSVSETTLEQIFIAFAKLQEEETGAVAGIAAGSPPPLAFSSEMASPLLSHSHQSPAPSPSPSPPTEAQASSTAPRVM